MLKARELRTLDEDELNDKLRELKETLFNLRFQHATGQLDNPMKIKDMRRDIARVCTVITEREYAIRPEAFEEALSGPLGPLPEEPEEAIREETEEESEEDAPGLRQSAGETEEEVEEETGEETREETGD